MKRIRVVLLDEQLNESGDIEKLEAHRRGLLHKAFSVFIFDTTGRLLLQRRAEGKYHSGGLWSNTCCGHPVPGESTLSAAGRRLYEEMGLNCPLTYSFRFTYRAELGNGLTEYESDHVYYGITDEQPNPDPAEASEWKHVSLEELSDEMEKEPERFTSWLKICFADVQAKVWPAMQSRLNTGQ